MRRRARRHFRRRVLVASRRARSRNRSIGLSRQPCIRSLGLMLAVLATQSRVTLQNSLDSASCDAGVELQSGTSRSSCRACHAARRAASDRPAGTTNTRASRSFCFTSSGLGVLTVITQSRKQPACHRRHFRQLHRVDPLGEMLVIVIAQAIQLIQRRLRRLGDGVSLSIASNVVINCFDRSNQSGCRSVGASLQPRDVQQDQIDHLVDLDPAHNPPSPETCPAIFCRLAREFLASTV